MYTSRISLLLIMMIPLIKKIFFNLEYHLLFY